MSQVDDEDAVREGDRAPADRPADGGDEDSDDSGMRPMSETENKLAEGLKKITGPDNPLEEDAGKAD
jgi:hypothetical protein